MPKDRELNPVAAQRKKDKAKELRRNRDLRKQHREATLHSLTPDAIEQQLGKIRRVERGGGGVVDVHVVQKRQRLEVELVEARKRQQLQMEEEQKRASEQQPTVVIKGSHHTSQPLCAIHFHVHSPSSVPFTPLFSSSMLDAVCV